MSGPKPRRLTAVAAAWLLAAALAGCGGHPSTPAGGMKGMDMKGMDMNGAGDDMPGMGEPSGPKIVPAASSDNGLHATLDGYSFVAGTPSPAADTAAPFAFHITGPSGKTVTRFQPYEGELLVFYLARTDLSYFRRLTASMRDDGTWTVPMPALKPGSYRAYITFAAPDSSAGTPLAYSLSQPLTVSGGAVPVSLPPTADTATADGYTLRLTGTPHPGTDANLGVTVTKDGKPVQQFDRLLDGYAHLTAFHSGDAAFARALSTGRSAGGPGGAGALTATIRFPEAGAWRLFVQFEASGIEHTAAFTVEVS